MGRLIVGLLFLIASVYLGLKIAEDPGLAMFQYRDWSVEMPLWFAALSAFLLVLVLYFIIRFFDSIDSSYYRFKNWLRWRRRSKSYSKTNRGLLELVEGHWRNAENLLLEGIDQSDAPLINYLAAAKAAHERGAFDKRDMYIRTAYDIAPQAEIVIGITQAQLQLNQGQVEQAHATLERLHKISPRHPVVLKLLERVYIHTGDWKALLNLIPSLRKAKLYTTENLDNLEQHAYQELLNLSVKRLEGLEMLRAIWKSVPRRLQQNPQLIACYAKHIAHYPEASAEVEELITKTLKKSWDDDLVKIYGTLVTPHPQKQLKLSERWLENHHNQPTLLLTLARLCVRCQLWGKARS